MQDKIKVKKDRSVIYPYVAKDGSFGYVSADNKYILAAKETARRKSLDKVMPTGTVLVKDGQIIGRGANGSTYHEQFGCERVRLNIPTGEGYELCEGCSPKNHSEPRAVKDALSKGNSPEGAEAYLWGHWWCCEPCWATLLANGINQVFLVDGSEVLFNKLAPENIVGKQFA